MFLTINNPSNVWWPIEDRGPCTLWGREVVLNSGAKRLEYKVTRGELSAKPFVMIDFKAGVPYIDWSFDYARVPPSDSCKPITGSSKRRAWKFWYAKERTEVNKYNLDKPLPSMVTSTQKESKP